MSFNYEFENLLNQPGVTVDDLVNNISFYDLSSTKISNTIFVGLFERNGLNLFNLEAPFDQLRLLEAMVKNGLDLNKMDSSFSYGHFLVRHSEAKLIKFALDNGFHFNSYTENGWHCLSLIQLNFLSPNSEKDEMLAIIKEQLDKGINIKSMEPTDFLTKLDKRSKYVGFNELIELYRNDKVMMQFITDNMSFIIDNNLHNIMPKDVVDVFIF